MCRQGSMFHIKQPQPADGDDTIQEDAVIEAAALKRVSRVALPLLFLTAIMAYLDKSNMNFAAIKLNAQFDINSLEYGVGSGLYYAGFGLAILPSTFMTMRFGARRWMGTMAVAWGVVSTCHALIDSRRAFYALRCLLGAAEAAGTSSGGHLLAQFYPQDRLAMPFTVVVLSQVVSPFIAAPLAAGLMSMDGLGGLHGWQYLFLLEGIPSVLLGVAMWVWLPSHPLWDAWMLSPEEGELLHARVHGSPEKADEAREPPRWVELLWMVLDALRRPLLYFFIVVGVLWGLGFFSMFAFLPVLIQNMLSGTALEHSTSSGLSAETRGRPPVKAILLSAVPSVAAAVAMVALAWHSDQVAHGEKALHVAIPYLVGGVILTCYAPMASVSFAAGFVNLVLALTAANAAIGVVSSRVVVCFDTKAVGVGLALYTLAIACFSGFLGPVIVGALVHHLHSFAQATVANGVFITAAGLLMVGLALWEHRQARLARAQATADDAAAADSGSSSHHTGMARADGRSSSSHHSAANGSRSSLSHAAAAAADASPDIERGMSRAGNGAQVMRNGDTGSSGRGGDGGSSTGRRRASRPPQAPRPPGAVVAR